MFPHCGRIESKLGCFGASSPVDLTMVNNGDSDLIVSLFDHSEKDGYNLLGTVRIKAQEEKTICLDNEGTVVNGLYIYYYSRTFKIEFSNSENFRMNLMDSAHHISTIKELEYLRAPKW